MQVTFTVNLPERRRMLRMHVRPGAVALGKARSVDALPATQVMPVIAAPSPLDDPAFMAGVMTLLREQPQPMPAPKPRKPTRDFDADRLQELRDYHAKMRAYAEQEQAFVYERTTERDAENARRVRQGKPEIPADMDVEQESQAKIAAYTLVADCTQRIAAALETNFDAYLDALPQEIARLERAVTGNATAYHQMRDSILSACAAEMAAQWMGE